MTHRTLTRRNLLLASTAAAGLSACASPAIIGREDRNPAEGGIGGTGIVGLVTDFGSLIVNGLKVETRPYTRFTTALGRITEADISRGDALTVEAETRNGVLIARRVHVTHPITALVQNVSQGGAQLVVGGVSVDVEPHAKGIAKSGMRVAVAGLWRAGRVKASRIIPVGPGQDIVAGAAQIRNGILLIGDLPIRPKGIGTPVDDGQFATVYGTISNGALTPSRIIPGRFVGAAGALRRLSIEGYLDPSRTAPGFQVAGLGHSFAQDINLSPFQATRTLFEGNYTGRFDANRGLILPEAFDARRSLMQDRLNGRDQGLWSAIE